MKCPTCLKDNISLQDVKLDIDIKQKNDVSTPVMDIIVIGKCSYCGCPLKIWIKAPVWDSTELESIA